LCWTTTEGGINVSGVDIDVVAVILQRRNDRRVYIVHLSLRGRTAAVKSGISVNDGNEKDLSGSVPVHEVSPKVPKQQSSLILQKGREPPTPNRMQRIPEDQ